MLPSQSKLLEAMESDKKATSYPSLFLGRLACLYRPRLERTQALIVAHYDSVVKTLSTTISTYNGERSCKNSTTAYIRRIY
jgi:7-cyano-7-deazaguanine synthase in queuosine biosynthesis